ncbi:glycosyltransferase [Pedobacter changchengzhani]|uniref:Glycosyltransferase n=1 Tax=Pedobacter changchengzhani TaxID=2529274 RepID=A0A4R5MJC4_9SPHI|nr:glycosyltransferase [Pedobacter changchengzhani]TDG35285.1 glycosyltransferase [Pedobacter changchengzhani]
MRIIQIIASYKPAYIYGGPTMSVAKLCEALVKEKTKDQSLKLKDRETNQGSIESPFRIGGDQNEKTKDQSSKTKGEETKNEQRTTIKENQILDIEVFTTLANGKTELNIKSNERQIVDGVPVTYFNRITKDHTHFSPALLLALRRRIQSHKKNIIVTQRNSVNNSLSFGEGRGEALVIHIHAWWNLVSIFSCLIAKWYKIPVVLSPRGMLTSYTQENRNGFVKKIIHQLLGKRLLSYCHIHATSELEKQDILNFIQPKSITVIPNLVELGNAQGVESEKLRVESLGIKPAGRTGWDQSLKTKDPKANKEQGAKSNEEALKTNEQTSTTYNVQRHTTYDIRQTINEPRPFKLIFLSRIEEKKGLELLFEALAKLKFTWELTIAGSGEEEYVESLMTKVKSLKLDAKVNWVGQVNNDAKFNLLAQHDLMVLTSYNENFANVVVESLSVGTPVLISNKVGLADYVKENNFGWITNLEAKQIGEEIEKAFVDIQSRNLIRENAPTTIAHDFSAHLVDRYIQLYQTIS